MAVQYFGQTGDVETWEGRSEEDCLAFVAGRGLRSVSRHCCGDGAVLHELSDGYSYVWQVRERSRWPHELLQRFRVILRAGSAGVAPG